MCDDEAGSAVAAFMVRSFFPIFTMFFELMYFYTGRYIYHNANARVPYAPMTPSDSSYSVAYEVGLTTVGDFDAVVSYC